MKTPPLMDPWSRYEAMVRRRQRTARAFGVVGLVLAVGGVLAAFVAPAPLDSWGGAGLLPGLLCIYFAKELSV